MNEVNAMARKFLLGCGLVYVKLWTVVEAVHLRFAVPFVVLLIVFTMERRMLLGLKARAEGRPEAPAALLAIAQLGWAAAGVTVAGLFLSQRRRRSWLVLPAVAALPALLTSSDVPAGLAAFLAVGITLLGFLTFGRRWWGAFLVIGSVVLLTLLLAPDAYLALGLAIALLLLASVGAMVAARPGAPAGAPRRLATPTG